MSFLRIEPAEAKQRGAGVAHVAAESGGRDRKQQHDQQQQPSADAPHGNFTIVLCTPLRNVWGSKSLSSGAGQHEEDDTIP